MGKGRNKRRRAPRKKTGDALAPMLPENPQGPSEPDAQVLATLKPKPRAGSGAIALPEPDEEEVLTVAR